MRTRWGLMVSLIFCGLCVGTPAWPQAFSSGSTGALGALNATTNTTIDVTPMPMAS